LNAKVSADRVMRILIVQVFSSMEESVNLAGMWCTKNLCRVVRCVFSIVGDRRMFHDLTLLVHSYDDPSKQLHFYQNPGDFFW